MKFFRVALLVACMVLAFGSMALAANPNEGSLEEGNCIAATTDVNAIVGQYAKVEWTGGQMITFSGEAGQTVALDPQNPFIYTVESNCSVEGDLVGTDLTLLIPEVGNWTIPTEYKLNDGDYLSSSVVQHPALGEIGIYTGSVLFRGTTGAISGQHSGTYSATLTLTVSASI